MRVLKRRQLYIRLLLFCFTMLLFGYMIFDSENSVRKGNDPIERSAERNRTIAKKINTRPIVLSVNGDEIDSGTELIYVTEELEVMIPAAMFRKVFYCALSYYDNQTLLLEKNTVKIEMKLGEKQMLVNNRSIALHTPLTESEDILYIPLGVAQLGFEYTVNLLTEENKVIILGAGEDDRFLPSQYDYRTRGRSPEIKNQGSLGTCWTFASLAALETTLLPEQNLEFAADHMSIKNSFYLSQDDGGEYTMSMAYLTAWQGPVLESDDPYGDGASPDGLEAVKHVQEIQILPNKNLEKIKEAVYLYGGVQSSLYTSLKSNKSHSIYYNRETNSYCYIGTDQPNHDVVIIGWDDHYPKENFGIELENDGAFLCINSWGEDFGDQGFFYVSYYDTNIGLHNILYSKIEDVDNYSNIYQTDLCGWIGQMGYGQEDAYFANVYEARGAERLEAAGFYATGPDSEYEILLARDITDDGSSLSENKIVASGGLINAGYYTIPFDQSVDLEKGERYGIIVKIKTPGVVHPIAIEYQTEDSRAEVDISDGEGYISLRGEKWERTEENLKSNICLKAYTTNRENP